MLNNVIIGQYVEGNSFIHHMDAKAKIIISFLYMIMLFAIKTVPSYLVVSVFTLLTVFVCSVPLKLIIKGLKPMILILIFTAVLNLLMTRVLKRAKAMIPILVPLFVSAFRRADELACAMEARCYHGGEGRTKMTESHMGKRDCIAFCIFIVTAVIITLTEILFR